MSKNRITHTGGLISEYDHIFMCPLCSRSMKVVDLKSMVCDNNHCFDLSRYGYVNFSTQSFRSKYGRSLFQSRRWMLRRQIFEPAVSLVANWMNHTSDQSDRPVTVLDAGCGEGTHLAQLCGRIHGHSRGCIGVGIDISKEGIREAARDYCDFMFSVGNIAHLPFADGQFDFVTNILSPSNYAEFKRVLNDRGFLIKVIPGVHHLEELRTLFYRNTNRDIQSEFETESLFQRNFSRVKAENLTYKFALEGQSPEHLVNMTPLSWNVDKTVREAALSLTEVTIDLKVLLGTNSDV